MNIYVANLGYSTSENQVRDAFAAHGEVTSVKLIMDQVSGRPRGFGFVEMASKNEAAHAISNLNGMEFEGRAMNVSEAKEIAPRKTSNRW